MLDRDGYRPNVAIVIVNGKNLVFWGKRIREHSWQFPQGGINPGEAPEQAMYRELQRGSRAGAAARQDSRPHARLAALRGPAALDQARVARQLPRPEADLVSAAARRPRQRRQPARHRPSRIRRLALARLLDSARIGDRLQARSLSARADGARAFPAHAAANAARAPVRLGAPRNAARRIRIRSRRKAESCAASRASAVSGSRSPRRRACRGVIIIAAEHDSTREHDRQHDAAQHDDERERHRLVRRTISSAPARRGRTCRARRSSRSASSRPPSMPSRMKMPASQRAV